MKTHHFMVPINSLKRGKPRGNALRDYKKALFKHLKKEANKLENMNL